MSKDNIQYDAEIICDFANKLYEEADHIVQNSILNWGAVGAIPAVAIYFALDSFWAAAILFLAGAVPLGLIGYYLAKEKALKLKLEAQLALCQVQIEKNSRSES